MAERRLQGQVTQRLFGRTRQAILALLFARPDQSFYQQEITRAAGVRLSAVQRELGNLVAAGLAESTRRGNRVYYQANRASPIFAEVQAIVLKTAGLVDVLREALEPMRDRIGVAFVFGSLASGTATSESDVDVMTVGDIGLRELAPLVRGARQKLGREVNPVAVRPAEWAERCEAGDHFITTVLEEPKVFLYGDQDELERIARGGTAAPT